jgi:hypothetical protein
MENTAAGEATPSAPPWATDENDGQISCIGLKRAHNFVVKTSFELSALPCWMRRSGVALIALTFCASAFADPSKNVVVTSKASATKGQTEAQQLASKKQLYISILSSGIPQPIEWVAVPIATTVVPMTVLGGPPFGVKQPNSGNN